MATPNGLPATAWFEWGTTTAYGQTTSPREVGDGTGVVRVSAGISNLLGGQVYHGRLAVRTAAGVVLGSDQQFITFTGGRVVAWNADGVFQTNLPPDLSNVVAVAAGPDHNLALRNDGTVVAWGGYYNNNGTYVRMTVPRDLTNAVAIASGYSHALALRSDGTVVVSGANSEGQRKTPASLSNVESDTTAVTPRGLPRSSAMKRPADPVTPKSDASISTVPMLTASANTP